MKYSLEYTDSAVKALRKLDKHTRKLILSWINKNLYECEDPRRFGKALSANLAGKWRYRVGDYRIIAEIRDERVLILVISIGHRREIYS